FRGGDPVPVRHLDGHTAVQVIVVALVDNAESPLAKLRRYPVAPQAHGEVVVRDSWQLGTGGNQVVARFLPTPRRWHGFVFRPGTLAHGAFLARCCCEGLIDSIKTQEPDAHLRREWTGWPATGVS